MGLSPEGHIVAVIVQADIENVFGVRNVAIWSNLDNDSETVNTARVTLAIASAESQVNNRFRNSLYVVPLTPESGTHDQEVKNWHATLAGAWLYGSREDSELSNVSRRRSQVNASMDAAIGGSDKIPYTRKEAAGSAPWVG